MRNLLATTLLLLGTQALAQTPQAPTTEQLLKEADRSRGGIETGISWDVTVEATEDGDKSERSFKVKARGSDALVEAVTPARHKGEVMLFNDRTIWFIKPGLRKPVSISARQKLSGEAANGDIASTNYARDYEGTVAGEEKVNGEDAFRLELKARAKNVTYDRIRYWVSKSRKLGLKADFITVSGELFKSATFDYANSMKTEKGELPFVSQMTIQDAANPGNTTVVRFAAPRAEVHPESLFNINNVTR